MSIACHFDWSTKCRVEKSRVKKREFSTLVGESKNVKDSPQQDDKQRELSESAKRDGWYCSL